MLLPFLYFIKCSLYILPSPQMCSIFYSNLSSKYQPKSFPKPFSAPRWAPWTEQLLVPHSPCHCFSSLLFPASVRVPLPTGWAISTGSDILPLVPLPLQSITCCQTNLSTPFPALNLSRALALSELPISPQPTLTLSAPPLPLSSWPVLLLPEPEPAWLSQEAARRRESV